MGLKLCLAASGGGHVRQLLDLEPVWSRHDRFFITEETALGESLAKDHRTFFLPHFAWGQAKLGAPLRMLRGAIQSFFASLRIMRRERPDVVISTGAGAVIFPVLLGRLMGAHVVVIESFARFDHPSLFGRLAAPLAHDLIIQSEKLRGAYPRAQVFDPLRTPEGDPPAKSSLLFATVGATLPFDRLANSVGKLKAEGVIAEDVLLQTGVGGARPDGVEVRETIDFSEVQSLLERASIVVCHGGTGSLITALRQGCHVIAMPRLAALGEHYDDHQSEITEAFAARGLIQVAKTEDELRVALAALPGRPRLRATTDPQALVAFLNERLGGLRPRRFTGRTN
ncbi:beta-1,4-glucuronosyltransferase WelK [Phenylobacterium sp.]|jgi:UDP-N-acetylglucosamine transferase subunit ALG13|uniref:beta-1,4-glucuronosyltransferase WelK n=1 Tax=Phenylobacterium sp. TaxID=1871053 RepID=UPI0037C65263